jgi:hypothetical protein
LKALGGLAVSYHILGPAARRRRPGETGPRVLSQGDCDPRAA